MNLSLSWLGVVKLMVVVHCMSALVMAEGTSLKAAFSERIEEPQLAWSHPPVRGLLPPQENVEAL